jgi:hypothetical protein
MILMRDTPAQVDLRKQAEFWAPKKRWETKTNARIHN